MFRMLIVAVVFMAIVVAATIYPLVSPIRWYLDAPTPLEQIITALTATVWLVVLLVSMARQPGGRLWKLIFLAIATGQIWVLGYVPNSLAFSIGHLLDQVSLAVFLHLLLAFPSGHLRDRIDRAVVLLGYAFVGGATLLQLLRGGEWVIGCNPDCVRDLFVLWPNPDLYEWLRNGYSLFGVSILFPLVLWDLWRHWRDAGPAARRSLLPLVVAVPLMAVVSAADRLTWEFDIQPAIDFFDSPSGVLIVLLVPLVLPVGLLVGILRTRWSRGRIASLVVDLGRGVPLGGLRDVLARALGDPTLQLAFAAPSGSGFVDASGQPTELPFSDPTRMVTRLERDEELLGVLVHDPAIETEDPGLVEAVGNAARLALENERLAAEVQAQLDEVRASRIRIVEAADAERRRVERDLHDGAQQRLVALAMRLQVAKQTTAGASDLLDEATAELESAIGEVRGLARGIHPTILTEAGLAAAVDALAERAPVPVRVDVGDQRYERQVESTAYFVVAEALTNVARYASATEARVVIREEDGRLVVTVTDDGHGGADVAAGTGLRGLADRLGAVGGTLSLASPREGGTAVRADIPLGAAGGTADAPDPGRVAAMETHGGRSSAATLAAVRAFPRRPSAAPAGRRARSANPVTLIVAVTALIGLVAIGPALLNGPKPPIVGRSTTFAKPFYYAVPGDSGLQLFPGPYGSEAESDHLNVLARPVRAFEGISIWIVEEGLESWCSSAAPLAPRPPGRDGLLQYLHSIPRLAAVQLPPTTVDGRPAYRLGVTVKDGDSDCEKNGMALWRDGATPSTGQGILVPDDGGVLLIVFDVDEATIAIEVWSNDDIFAWIPKAEAIVGSMQFVSRSSSEATSSAWPAVP
jgi:signal transduction histidine kinase